MNWQELAGNGFYCHQCFVVTGSVRIAGVGGGFSYDR
jgi:hypothetical protein